MAPNVRSVIAQVHQKSRAMGSRRNFCSHPDHPALNRFTGTRLWPWMLTHGLGLAAGYGLGSLIFGYFTSKSELEKKKQELIAQYEQHFQQQEKLCSDLAASNPKS
ncbi:uncharacterized protein LOC110229801 isoform X1 [Arabidopsis lyrata subsp. lyrata]|uniref:uncharacterized protein LOC110229801 isoform X1 n=1 Tax=Arabidopsis lyrata subsp. lyrata TaxID=81972 RepID=UPI000A29E96A|nr:uncharacterized protein LOC110229801 isoform X1 [Arabidopsis lyrata subsp. lyrata]|eukprot:XP_020886375.1 uncharacterized protein LOC110229801 isoform X1 [Arabidopsis lyrata subsp. lyrata]